MIVFETDLRSVFCIMLMLGWILKKHLRFNITEQNKYDACFLGFVFAKVLLLRKYENFITIKFLEHAHDTCTLHSSNHTNA